MIKRRNLNGNKKNIGKRTKQKRRPGGAGKGSAWEKAEQGITEQAEPGCRRTGEDDGESDCEMRDVNAEKNEKRYGRQKPALDFDSAWEYNIYKYRKPCKWFIPKT